MNESMLEVCESFMIEVLLRVCKGCMSETVPDHCCHFTFVL